MILASDSPALNAGIDLSHLGFSTDSIGTSRPQGGAWDLGAIERKSGSGPAPQPTLPNTPTFTHTPAPQPTSAPSPTQKPDSGQKPEPTSVPESSNSYLQTGLVGCWLMDDGSGSLTADDSGNNFNGSLMNGTAWTNGYSGNGLSFDGINDYVNLGTFDVNGNQLTIAAWIRADRFNHLSVQMDESYQGKRRRRVRSLLDAEFDSDRHGDRVTLPPENQRKTST